MQSDEDEISLDEGESSAEPPEKLEVEDILGRRISKTAAIIQYDFIHHNTVPSQYPCTGIKVRVMLNEGLRAGVQLLEARSDAFNRLNAISGVAPLCSHDTRYKIPRLHFSLYLQTFYSQVHLFDALKFKIKEKLWKLQQYGNCVMALNKL